MKEILSLFSLDARDFALKVLALGVATALVLTAAREAMQNGYYEHRDPGTQSTRWVKRGDVPNTP